MSALFHPYLCGRKAAEWLIAMSNYHPTVSCIMSNYNTDIGMLEESINSILSQTYRDFELIIIDDQSTDDSILTIERLASIDKRIVVLKNHVNSGLAYSLNKGISISKGKYIARMDTDDISLPDRFQKQVEYLNEHPEVDILGTYAETFGDGNGLSFNPFVSINDCKCHLIFVPCLIHPTVMIRKSFLNEHNLQYNAKYLCSQDFDMWTRCADVGNVSMLRKVLLKYRIHGTQISNKKRELQRRYAIEICERQLQNIDIIPNDNELLYHLVLCGKDELTLQNINGVVSWKNRIIEANAVRGYYNDKALKKILNNRIFNLLLNSKIKKEKIVQLLIIHRLLTPCNLYSVLYRLIYTLGYRLKITDSRR